MQWIRYEEQKYCMFQVKLTIYETHSIYSYYLGELTKKDSVKVMEERAKKEYEEFLE